MLRVSLAILVTFLLGCAAPVAPTTTAPPAAYLTPIRFDDAGSVFAQPINVRMQGIGRRDFDLRIRVDLSGGADGLIQDFNYRGSVRTAPRPDGRTTFSIYVESIDGVVSARGQGKRIEVRETGLSQQIFESVHNLDNTFHEISFPLLNTLLDARRDSARIQERDAGRFLALQTLSENIWPLYPVRRSRLAVGTSIWPETPREFIQLFESEMIPAIARSPQFREIFDRLPATERRGISNYDQFVSAVGGAMTSMFRGSDTSFGGRITGARIWNGQDVLESSGPVRATLTLGTGSNSAAARLAGNNHMLIDPFSGITLRTEFSAAIRIAAPGGQSIDGAQQISAMISPQERSLRIPAVVPTPGLTPVAPRGDVPAGGAARRISDIYSETIGSIFTVRADTSQGTGFAISRDTILTNRHVIEGARGGWVELTQNGALVSRAKVERVFDGANDLAVLKTERPLDLTPLSLARDLPSVGTEVLIIGSPIGLEGSITGGIVSQLRVIARAGYVQVDAAINPGNSGGPVFDRLGRVVGIATMRIEPSRTGGSTERPVIGIGFALSSETVLNLLSTARVSSIQDQWRAPTLQ